MGKGGGGTGDVRDTDEVHDGEVDAREPEVVGFRVAEDVVRLADDACDRDR